MTSGAEPTGRGHYVAWGAWRRSTTASIPALAAWIEAQPLFFVATAPLAADGLVNLSPKGTLGTVPGARRAHLRLPRHHRQRGGDRRPPAGERPDLRDVLRLRRQAEHRAPARHRTRCSRPARPSSTTRSPASAGAGPSHGGVPAGGDRRRRGQGVRLLRIRGAPDGAGRRAGDAGRGLAQPGRRDDRHLPRRAQPQQPRRPAGTARQRPRPSLFRARRLRPLGEAAPALATGGPTRRGGAQARPDSAVRRPPGAGWRSAFAISGSSGVLTRQYPEHETADERVPVGRRGRS